MTTMMEDYVDRCTLRNYIEGILVDYDMELCNEGFAEVMTVCMNMANNMKEMETDDERISYLLEGLILGLIAQAHNLYEDTE